MLELGCRTANLDLLWNLMFHFFWVVLADSPKGSCGGSCRVLSVGLLFSCLYCRFTVHKRQPGFSSRRTGRGGMWWGTRVGWGGRRDLALGSTSSTHVDLVYITDILATGYLSVFFFILLFRLIIWLVMIITIQDVPTTKMSSVGGWWGVILIMVAMTTVRLISWDYIVVSVVLLLVTHGQIGIYLRSYNYIFSLHYYYLFRCVLLYIYTL